MKFGTVCTAALLLLAWPGSAHAVPRYDVPNYCKEVSDISGGSSMIYNSCIEMEQDAYDGLKSQWESIPSRTRDYCDEVGRVSGGSYSILKSCVEMETDAAGETPEFRY